MKFMLNIKYKLLKIDFLYSLLLLFLAIWLFRGALFQGKVFIARPADCYFSHYSFAHFFKNMLQLGIFPLWYPYSACGLPFGVAGIGNITILHLLSVFLNVDLAWNLRITGITFLSGLLTYIYCQRIQLAKFPAFFAALVFMLSAFTRSFTSNFAESSTFYLPLLLLIAENYAKAKNSSWMALLGIATAALYLDSNFQFVLYVSIFAFIYTLLRTKSWIAVLPFIFALGISSFQFLRQFELASLCDRPVFWFIDLLLPTHLLGAIFPFLFESPFRPEYNFFFAHLFEDIARKLFQKDILYIFLPFTGVITLIFCFIASRSKKFVKIYGITCLTVIFYWMFFPLLSVILKYVPFINKLTAIDRLGVLYTFSLAILSGFGAERLLSDKVNVKKINLVFLSLASCVIVFLLALRFFVSLNRTWLVHFFKRYIETNVLGNSRHLASKEFYLARIEQFFSFINSWTNIFDPSILLPILFLLLSLFFINLYNRRRIRGSYFKPVIVLILLFDLYIFSAFNMTYTALPEELVPRYKIMEFLNKDKDVYRIMPVQDEVIPGEAAVDRRFLAPDSSGIYGISSIESYFNLYIGRYYQLFKYFSKAYDPHLISVIAGGEGNFDLALADLMNVKYFLSYGGVKMPFPVAYQDEKFTLYFNTGYFYRGFMVYDYEVISEKNKILPRMKQIKERLKKTVLLEEEPEGFEKKQGDIPNSVRINKYSSQAIELEIKTPWPGLLVLTDTYYPGWKATVDNLPVKIYTADYAFRAIVVPQGQHKIGFCYEPFTFRLGLMISALFLLLALALCIKPISLAAIKQ